MQSVKFEKDGVVRSVTADKENILCMERAGWKQITEALALPSWAVAVPEQPATIPAQPEPVKRSPGRPRKEVPSILNGE